MTRLQYDDAGVVQTMVRDVIQDGAGPKKRERFVLGDHSRCVLDE